MHRFLFALVLLVLVLCIPRPSAAQHSSRPEASPPPVSFSVDDFRGLRWLEGNWRGAAPGEPAFHEGYRFVDDSTMVMTYYADSTFTRPTGTATVELRNGRVYHRSGGALWVLTRSDASGLHFSPVERARNRFLWRRESAAVWTASLFSSSGRAVVYRLTRIPSAQPD